MKLRKNLVFGQALCESKLDEVVEVFREGATRIRGHGTKELLFRRSENYFHNNNSKGVGLATAKPATVRNQEHWPWKQKFRLPTFRLQTKVQLLIREGRTREARHLNQKLSPSVEDRPQPRTTTVSHLLAAEALLADGEPDINVSVSGRPSNSGPTPHSPRVASAPFASFRVCSV